MDELKMGVYRHFKGGLYLVIGIARHSETEEEMVVYVPLYPTGGAQMAVRPRNMFEGEASTHYKMVKRFTFIGTADETEGTAYQAGFTDGVRRARGDD